ncbi:cytochrome P450 [Microdochium bolleyi]|uniref:Cytochrome P450 n=1 Tax=Microdochium bolleyi TaxID=196109 RepID=A0A136IJ74_9PEZI|nr:cytochrome P450 [Microdochium bolleyi]
MMLTITLLAVLCTLGWSKQYHKRAAEYVMTFVLAIFHPIKSLSSGERMPGPSWKWTDGQMMDKFLNGFACSRNWRRHGPIYRIASGAIPEVVITLPEDVRTFYSDSPSHEKSRSSNGGWLFHQLLGECLGLINGETWKGLRAAFGPAFSHAFVGSEFVRVDEQASSYIDDMPSQTFATVRDDNSLTANVAEAVSAFPFFCTAEYLYGPLSPDEKSKLWSIGQMNLELMGHVLGGGLTRFPFATYVNRDLARKLARFQSEWTQFNSHVHQTRKHSAAPPPFVSTWNSVESGELMKEEVLHTLSEILFANLDVSTGVLSWLLYFLAGDSSVQNQLREEIMHGREDLQSYCKRKDTLLSYCMMESFRLRPFTAFSIPESSPADKVLSDYLVPANTSVVVDTLSINYNPDVWGADSEEFRPMRFHGMKATELRYNLFVFGLGTRKCLGQYFGELMIKTFVVRLLERYTMTGLGGPQQAEVSGGSKDSWVPLSNVQIHLQALSTGV